MKIVTIKLLISSGMWGLAIVLVVYGSGNNRLRVHEREWIGWFAILILCIFPREYYLQQTNFLSLSNNESVIVSAVIHVHTSDNQEEIKTVSVLTKIVSAMVIWCSLNWLNGYGREKASGRDCRNGCL